MSKTPVIITSVRKELTHYADKTTKESARRFFKESIKLYGVKLPIVNKIAKQFFKVVKIVSKSEIFDICELFWQSGYFEEAIIASHWTYSLHDQFTPSDFATFEHWVNHYVTNWATCDTLCNHTIGTFIDTYPEYVTHLKDWAKSDNRWVKRASAVTLIIPARQGKFLPEIFTITDTLLTDPDDLVQKGYGWLLKATSEAYQPEVFAYVSAHKQQMPRTALRYAIEKMPPELRHRALSK